MKYLILGGVLALTLAGTAAASYPTNPNRIRGPICANHQTGVLRWVMGHQKCRKHEVRWMIPKPGRAAQGTRLGPAGPAGPQGPVGPQGAAGAQGAVGPHGAAGAKGETGAQGVQGSAGAQGPAGQNGQDGTSVTAVSDPENDLCVKLYSGLVFVKDICSIAGPQGPQGEQGAQGEQGPQGDVGPQGLDGAPGAAGQDGAAGAQGPQGETGAQGPQGPAGPQGDVGPAGAQGPQGPAGPQGPEGPKGAAGLDGSAVITVAGGAASGDKQFTVNCPANYVALSGGFNIQGSVTASYRSDDSGDPVGNTSWTIKQSSGASLSGTVYVYCVAAS